MFSPKPEKKISATEDTIIKKFLATSHDFKKMQEISSKAGERNPYANTIESIERATTFADILRATKQVDFEHLNHPTATKLSPAMMEWMVFFGSFVATPANFAHYA